jgi:hypothetical protein
MVAGELQLAVSELRNPRQGALEVAREIPAHGVELNAHSLEALSGLAAATDARARRAEQCSPERRNE